MHNYIITQNVDANIAARQKVTVDGTLFGGFDVACVRLTDSLRHLVSMLRHRMIRLHGESAQSSCLPEQSALSGYRQGNVAGQRPGAYSLLRTASGKVFQYLGGMMAAIPTLTTT